MTTLAELKPGEKAKIIGFERGHRAYRRKLLAMGLTPNTYFEVIRRAPLGDPVEIRIRDYHLSLRQAETGILLIQREN